MIPAPQPKRVERAPSPTSVVVGVSSLIVSPPRLALLRPLPWGDGPSGRDSSYAFQKLGWPWARAEQPASPVDRPGGGTLTRDLITGLRLSAIGDGSCYYHSMYKCIGKLRTGIPAGAPFFADSDFVDSLDYLDVDYRDADSIQDYMAKKRIFGDIYVGRQAIVDTWRNDIYKWFFLSAVNTSVDEYYTPEEASRVINEDIRNMKIWIREDALNPLNIRFLTTNKQASIFLDVLLGGDYLAQGGKESERKQLLYPDKMNEVYEVYIGRGITPEARFGSDEMNNIIAYMTESVANNDAVSRISGAIRLVYEKSVDEFDVSAQLQNAAITAGWNAALFTNDEARQFIISLMEEKGRTLISNLIEASKVMERYDFYNEVINNFKTRISARQPAALLIGQPAVSGVIAPPIAETENKIRSEVIEELKVSNPDWYKRRMESFINSNREAIAQQILDTPETEYTFDDIPLIQEPWINEIMKIGVERLAVKGNAPALVVDQEVAERLNLRQAQARNLELLRNYNWGLLTPLMNEKTSYIDVLRLIDDFLTQSSARAVKDLFREQLSGEYLRAIESYIDGRAALIQRVKTKCGFDPSQYEYEKYSHKQLNEYVINSEAGWKIVYNSINIKTNAKFTENEVNNLKMRDPRTIVVNGIPLAAKYVRSAEGYMTATPQLDPEMMRIPINSNYFMSDNGFHLRAQVYESNINSIREMLPVRGEIRHDAGEDILPWFSRLLAVNSHILRCYPDFVWIYTSYTSGDLNQELPDTPHVFINNTGAHYEVFASVSPDGVITTLFNNDHSLVKAFYMFERGVTDQTGRRLNYEDTYNMIKASGKLYPDIETPLPNIVITSISSKAGPPAAIQRVTSPRSPMDVRSLLSDLPTIPGLQSLPPLTIIPGLQRLPVLPTIPGLQPLPPLPTIPGLQPLPPLTTIRGFKL